jgi:hypothetical protein
MAEYVPVRTIVGVGLVIVCNTTNDDSTDGPEHLQHLGSGSSQLNRGDFTAVCRCICNEDSPWDALQNLGQEHDWKRLGEVEDEDEAVQEHETGDGRPPISDLAGERTSQHDTMSAPIGPLHWRADCQPASMIFFPFTSL